VNRNAPVAKDFDEASTREQLRDFIQARLLAGTSERLGSDAGLRVGLATSLLIGMVVCRRIIGVPVLVAAEAEELVTLIAPAIQQVLVPHPTSTAEVNRGRNAHTSPLAANPTAIVPSGKRA